ncbi:MAG: transcriptional regulator [Candidatus Methanoperedenaceae archaeon]|nr:MAG: transcriptional regulator [Candidatus Methanoperedenaceae archaeon]
MIKSGIYLTENRKGISKTESYLLSKLSEEGREIFTIRDATDVLKRSCVQTRKIISNLKAKKWIEKIEAGKYLIMPLSAGVKPKYTEHEFVIGSKLIEPYYIAFWSALNYYHLTEQIPFSVFIATTKRRSNRKILDVEYLFVTLSRKKFFGYTAVNIAGKNIFISEKEKTIADCLDHPEYCGDITEVAKALKAEGLFFEKIVDHAKKMGNATILKRLGYLSEILDLKLDEDFKKTMLENISKGYSVLDPSIKSRKGKYNEKWKLLINRKIGEEF